MVQDEDKSDDQKTDRETPSAGPIPALKEQASGAAYALYTRIVNRPIAVTVVCIAVLVFGAASLDRIPMTLMPDMSYPTLTIRTTYPTATPRQVEQRVSELIEERVANVPGLIRWSSVSRAEQSDVVLEFNWGTDMLAASTQVSEALDRVRLAREIERPNVLRYDPSQDPIMRIMLFAKDADTTLAKLRKFAEDNLKPKLARLEGVAAVRVAGGIEEQLRVELKESELNKNGIDVRDVVNVINSSNVDASAGLLSMHGRELLLRVLNPYNSIDDVKELDLRTSAGNSVKLRDVAELKILPKEPETITRYASEKTEYRAEEGVLLEILKEGDSNIIDSAANVWQELYGARHWVDVRDGKDYPTKKERDEYAASVRKEGISSDRDNTFGLMDDFPDGFGLTVLSDQSIFIEDAVGEVRDAVFWGGLLAVLIIFLFLNSGYATLLIAVSIPLSVVAAFVPMKLSDLTLNLMTLGGLALGVGMLVDNSVVVLESIARCREEGDSPMVAAARGTSEVASAIVASTLTTIAVFFPIVFVEGMAGQIFNDQSLTVVYSLIASLGAALLVIPAFAAMSTKGVSWDELWKNFEALLQILKYAAWPKSVWKCIVFSPLLILNSVMAFAIFLVAAVAAAVAFGVVGLFGFVGLRIVRFIGVIIFVPMSMAWRRCWSGVERVYPLVLAGALDKPALILGGSATIALLAGFLATNLSTELVPPLNENEIYLDLAAPEGTRLVVPADSPESFRSTDRDARAVTEAAFEEGLVRESVRGIMLESGGSNDVSGRPVGANRARLVISLNKGDTNIDEVGETLRNVALDNPAFTQNATLARPTLFTLRAPVSLEVRGYNLSAMEEVADRALELLKNLRRDDGEPLLLEVKGSSEEGKPQIPIVWDRLKLIQYNLNQNQLEEALRYKIAGAVISEVDQESETIDIFVNLKDKERLSVEELRNIEVAQGIRVGDLLDPEYADLKIVTGPSQILRTGNDRVIEITALPNDVALGLVRARIEEALERANLETDDIRIILAGQQEELERSKASLIFALLLAVFLVYVVMAVQFESLIDPLLIMGTVPLAAVGVIVILWMNATPVSVVVMLGMIVLAGIVVNNAIVLVDYANKLRSRGLSVRDAVTQAARVRLRPIAITTMTTVLGMLPLTGWIDPALNAMASLFSEGSTIYELLSATGEGREVRAPLAVTVVVGLISSTALTLLVIPTLYSLVHKDRKPTSDPDQGDSDLSPLEISAG